MAEKIVVMRTEGASAPAPEVDRSTTTWNHWTGENGRLLCGIWESEPGKSDVDCTEWEFCHFIAGKAVLTNEAGESWTLEAGDGFIIPPGFKGTWETVEKVRKHYVILLPKS